LGSETSAQVGRVAARFAISMVATSAIIVVADQLSRLLQCHTPGLRPAFSRTANAALKGRPTTTSDKRVELRSTGRVGHPPLRGHLFSTKFTVISVSTSTGSPFK